MFSSVTQSIELHTIKCICITHPQDPALIIGVGPNAIHILDWNLAERQTFKFEYPRYQSMPLNPESLVDQTTVDRVLVTHDKKHVLVQISLLNQNSKEKTFLYFETSSCSISTAATLGIDQERDSIAITTFILPQNLSSEIAHSLCFLSSTLSICSRRLSFDSDLLLFSSFSTFRFNNIATATTYSTTPLNHHHHNNNINNTAEDHVKLRFSWAGDWISKDCLALYSIGGIERSMLCPRNGEVAVVRCAALL